MRCRAYQLPSEIYREIEPQLLEQLRDGDRDQLLYLLGDHDLEVELLSGEWRVLFAELSDYFQFVDVAERRARMAVSPDELEEFVEFLREKAPSDWEVLRFGISELADALPVGMDLVGVVFIEEDDNWLWTEHPYEIQAIRPEVYDLIAPHIQTLIDAGDHAALARLCGDHCEGAVEFSDRRWQLLHDDAQKIVPELVGVMEGIIAPPADYTVIRELISLVSNPRHQPSLDAWLRVHADAARYSFYFRDVGKETE